MKMFLSILFLGFLSNTAIGQVDSFDYAQGLSNTLYEDSIIDLKGYLQETPQDCHLYLALGNCYSSIGKYKQAIFYQNKALYFSRDSLLTNTIYLSLGKSYFNLNNYSKALKFFTKSRKLDSNNFELNLYCALVYYRKSEYSKSHFFTKKIVDSLYKANINPVFLANLGMSEYKMSNDSQALRLLLNAIEYKKYSPYDSKLAAYLYLARIYYKIGDKLNAELYLDKILLLDSENQEAKYLMAFVKFEKGEFESSLIYINSCIRYYDDGSELSIRGRILTNLGRYDEAINDLKRALKKGYSYYCNIYLLEAYIQSGQYELASRNVDEILKKYPNFADAIFKKGVIYLRLNRDDACVFLKKAMLLGYNGSDINLIERCSK